MTILLEDKIESLSTMKTIIVQDLQPVATALEESGAIEILESRLSSFMEGIPLLMKVLDEVATVHPFVKSKPVSILVGP